MEGVMNCSNGGNGGGRILFELQVYLFFFFILSCRQVSVFECQVGQ